MVTMAEIAAERAVDPDAQAAVTDFLDYTEYLPSDLIRSLTLIRGLDESYMNNSYALHDLTKLYGELPTLETSVRPNAQELRSTISTHLDQALTARESAYAEACRLFDLADRHQNRLKSIIAKLEAIPKPPSRDPTPQPPSSPQAKRPRTGRKLENGISQRLTLNHSGSGTVASAILHRPRRRITVPGEVMPPYDPDEPIASTEASDWGSPPPSPIRPILKLKQPKPPKEKVAAAEKVRQPRQQTVPYRKPTPPPDDAELGGEYRPWTHLTEYEMYKLRKKMKKNHQWEPSEVMIRRELAERGRGWDNYSKARSEAKASGKDIVDIDSSEFTGHPGPASHATPKVDKPEIKEIIEDRESKEKSEKVEQQPPPTSPVTSPAPKPKSVKKPEPKKEKREDAAREQASLAAQEAELAARRLGDIGSAFKHLFSPLSNALASLNRSSSTPTANGSSKKPIGEKSAMKRKYEEMGISASPSTEPDSQKKKQKTAPKPSPLPTSEPSVPRIPLKLTIAAPPASTPSTSSTPVSETHAPTAQRTSVAPKAESPAPMPSRPPSRPSNATSVEPPQPPITTRITLRTSTTPAAAALRKSPGREPTPKAVATAAARRSKRDAPGTVMQSSQDGGAAVSVSKRKTKPNKQNKAAQVQKAATDSPAPQIRVDVDGKQEIVDPDEERYCICGDVSYGEMICCELDEKCENGQWFHMECVSLVELPPRTVKWYCPGDRKKFHKGENSNGLVGRGIK